MPKIVKIHSENDVFQNIETLRRNREKRNAMGEFFFEGVRNINTAIVRGWKITAFLYAREKKVSRWAADILKQSTAPHHYELPLALMQKLSEKEEVSELIATAEIPKDDLTRIPLSENPVVLIFDRPSSPGNLGTLIRSADAFGVDGLIVTGHAVDVYDPETIRATTGSLFSLPVVRLPSHKELFPWMANVKKKHADLRIVATDEKGESAISDFDFTKPTILLVGNETHGLSASYKDLADAVARIPITGSASSLNVACASSIVLYEIARQRKFWS